MIAIEGIPRSMYHGPMLTNYVGVPGYPDTSLNGGLQHVGGLYFGEQKLPGTFQPTSYPPTISKNGPDESQQQQQQQQAKQQQQWKDALKQRKEYSALKKVILILQDNTLKTGDPKAAEKLRELNRSQSESCPLLKTILNVFLVSTAVILLIAVVIVIIYTSVKPSLPVSQSSNHHSFGALASSKSDSSSSLSSHDQIENETNSKQILGELHPRTNVQPSNSRCRIVPIVENLGAVRLGRMCFPDVTLKFENDN